MATTTLDLVGRRELRFARVAAETRLLPVPADDRVGVVAFEYRGPAARVLAGIFGAVAVAHAAAVTGSVSTTRTVVLTATTPAHANAVGRNGAVSVGEEIPGQTAEAAAVAQAGTITAIRNTVLTGPVAIAYAIAPAGVISAAGNTYINGPVATAIADTAAGVVDTIRNTSIEAPTAVVDAAAEQGAVTTVRNLTITGAVAAATAVAPAGVVEFVIHATILGQVATADATADAGTVTTTSNTAITAPVAEADADAVAGTITTDSNTAISGFVANATTTAHAGIVQAARNVTVTGTLATANAAAREGVVSTEINALLIEEFNGTTLNPRWVQESGTWAVSGGYAKSSSSDNSRIKTAVSGITNRVTAKTILLYAGPSGGAQSQYTGAGPAIYRSSTEYVAFYVNPTRGVWGVRNTNADVATGSISTSTAPFTVELVRDDTTYSCYLNGVLVHSRTVAGTGAWGVGVYQNHGSTVAEVDYIEARAL